MDEEFLIPISKINVKKIINKIKLSKINEKKTRRLIIYLSQDENKFGEFIEMLDKGKIFILFLVKYVLNNKERRDKYLHFIEQYLKDLNKEHLIMNKEMHFKHKDSRRKKKRRSEIKEFRKIVKNNNREDDINKNVKKAEYKKMINKIYSNLHKN